MSDDQDRPNDEKSQSESGGPVGGERLAEARREQQISVLDVAKELHLDEPKVRALERNDFDLLGAPVFAKGHLRKYAHLVGVDIDDLFADYYQLTRSAAIPPIVIGRSKVHRELSPGPWIAAIIVIVVAAAAYWWFAARDDGPVADSLPAQTQPEPSSGLSSEPTSEPIVETDDTVVLAAALPGNEADNGLVALPEQPVELLESTPESAPERVLPSPADAALRMSVSFSGDCWTEISDADGRRLFVGMGRSGRSVELTGKPPLRALFGNADNVSVRVNGADFAIPAATSRSRTVRLTIDNP